MLNLLRIEYSNSLTTPTTSLYLVRLLAAMTSGRTLITAYNVLAIVGIVSLTLIVCVSWLSPRVSRSATWFSFMISSAVSSSIGILIIGQQEGEDPDRALCVTQGILVNGIKVMYVYYSRVAELTTYGGRGRSLQQCIRCCRTSFACQSYLDFIPLFHTYKVNPTSAEQVFLEMMLFDREGKREVLSPRQVIMVGILLEHFSRLTLNFPKINVVPFVISLAVLIPGIVVRWLEKRNQIENADKIKAWDTQPFTLST